LIVGSAPTIAVAAGVFIATVAAHGGSAAPANLLPPLTVQCRQTSITGFMSSVILVQLFWNSFWLFGWMIASFVEI
jgi:hypothetical protein